MDVRIKRVYDSPDEGDGLRVLVDRLWPRGVSKQAAGADVWAKDIAPSPALRKWFSHESARFDEFRDRYRRELVEQSAAIEELLKQAQGGPITLLYAARDPEFNHARVLQEFMQES